MELDDDLLAFTYVGRARAIALPETAVATRHLGNPRALDDFTPVDDATWGLAAVFDQPVTGCSVQIAPPGTPPGSPVRTLPCDASLAAQGVASVRWDGRNGSGTLVSAGTYRWTILPASGAPGFTTTDGVATTVTGVLDLHGSLGFNDVAGNAFLTEIGWMSDTGLATGFADGGFKPTNAIPARRWPRSSSASCTAVPTPACSSAPFSDIPASNEFCGEIVWLASTGITGGFTDGTFRPTIAVSRQAMAVFLFRLNRAGSEAPGCASPPFNDVPANDQFCGEIRWLEDTGITTGFPDGGFHPASAVSRQAMSAFLYRYDRGTVG